ncbi:MAG: hypothetical protein ABH843_03945 [Candidatus Omnitrophota bacterium]
MIRPKLILSAIILILLMQPINSRALADTDAADEYFSYEKYSSAYMYFSKIERVEYRRDGLGERKIKALADRFVWGFDALSQKKQDEASVQFRKALRILPEYFHLDFILGLLYEEKGDYIKGAKFYASYLEKLKKFHEGMFPIAKPIITDTIDFDIKGYPQAYELIKQRLSLHGIDIDEAMNKKYPILPVAIIVLALAIAAIFTLTQKEPIKRSFYAAKARLYTSKDSWICTDCGKENSNINSACYNCDKPAGE